MGGARQGAAPDPWDRFWSAREDLSAVYPSSPRFLEALLAHLPPNATLALEIGAGTGRDAAALAARGVHAVALDAASESLLVIARAHPALVGRGIVGGDALHLPFADRTFDIVFHQGVLEHFGNPGAFLEENRRVTRPGGLLVVDVPQTFHAWTALKRPLVRAGRWFAGWETDYTMGELEALVRRAGYEVLDRYADWMVPSLAYRLLREAGRRAAIPLPLRPAGPALLQRARAALRRRLLELPVGRWTAHTIGVVARRPAAT